VGVTYSSPLYREPVIGGYTECGRYSGAVAAGATVSVQCTPRRRGRYVVVQFPTNTTDPMNFCELQVCAYGEYRKYGFDVILSL